MRIRNLTLITLIIVYAAFLRFWQIGQIPPLANPSNITGRYVIGLIGIALVMLVFLLSSQFIKSKKVALIASWIYASIPWTIERSRISSQIQMIEFLLLLFLLLFLATKRIIFKIISMAIIFSLLTYVVFTQQWIVFANQQNIPMSRYIGNIFASFSPTLIFFQSNIIWYSQMKEFGLLYSLVLPFFFLGLLTSIRQNKSIILFLSIFLIFASFNPFYPQSPELFFTLPFLSLISAVGISKYYQKSNSFLRFILFLVLVLLIYEISQFLHFYTVHYPQQILSNFSQIHESL